MKGCNGMYTPLLSGHEWSETRVDWKGWYHEYPQYWIVAQSCEVFSHSCWVNLSKRGGKDCVFRGLAGLLHVISRRRSPWEIQRSSLASRRKTPSFPTLLLRFRFLLGFCIGPPKIHRRFCVGLPKTHRRFRIGPTESVLALLNLCWASWNAYTGNYEVPCLLCKKKKKEKKPIWDRMHISGITFTYLITMFY